MGWVIKNSTGKNWEEKFFLLSINFKAPFSMITLTKNKLIAFRDTFGFRPLVLGQLNDSYIVCSETCALDTVGAKFIREIAPGEIIVIDEKGIQVVGKVKSHPKKLSVFLNMFI